jgi:hypothetical protein
MNPKSNDKTNFKQYLILTRTCSIIGKDNGMAVQNELGPIATHEWRL